jgi:Ca2+-binding EF-hand superfamily protein
MEAVMRVLLALSVMVSVGSSTALLRADEDAETQQQAEKLFKQFDKDGDGLVRGEEVAENRRSLFYRLIRFGDKDDSGALTQDEFVKAFAEQKPRPTDEADSPRQRRRPDPEQLFKQLDANHDGKIEPGEIPASRRELADRVGKKADKNSDGAVDRDEFIAALAELRARNTPRPEQLFKTLDADKDGKLTAVEVPPARRQLFERIASEADKDGDRALSEGEFVAGFSSARTAAREGSQGGGPIDAKQISARLKRLDANSDGKLSREEFNRPGARRFAQLDTNHDGVVDAGEIEAHLASLKKSDGSADPDAPKGDAKKESNGTKTEPKSASNK